MIKSKSFLLKSSIFLSAITSSSLALAADAVDPVSGAFNTLKEQVTLLTGQGWDLLISVTVTMICYKLVKKFFNRAS